MYVRRKPVVYFCFVTLQVNFEGGFLIPTKATLFGLDVRFRATDQKMEDEKSKKFITLIIIIDKRNAFKVKP